MTTQTIQQITDTFSKFRELQRSTGAIANTTNGLHRVYLVHGVEGQILEIGFASDPKLALLKASERLASNTINEQLRHARGVVLESASLAHYPKTENAISPHDIETAEQLDEHYHTAEIVLTIGADRSGTFVRSAIAGDHSIPAEAIENLPMKEVEPVTSDHPLAPMISIVETMALAIDTARQIIEKDGRLPDRDELDD